MPLKALWGKLETVIMATVLIFTGHQLHDLVIEGTKVVRRRFFGVEPSIALPIYALLLAGTLLGPLWISDKLVVRARIALWPFPLAFLVLFVAVWSYLGLVVGGGPHLYRLFSWFFSQGLIGAVDPWLDASGALQFLVVIPLAFYAAHRLFAYYVLARLTALGRNEGKQPT